MSERRKYFQSQKASAVKLLIHFMNAVWNKRFIIVLQGKKERFLKRILKYHKAKLLPVEIASFRTTFLQCVLKGPLESSLASLINRMYLLKFNFV